MAAAAAAAPTPPPPFPPVAAGAPSRVGRLVEVDEAWSLRIYEGCRGVPRHLLLALEISGNGWFWFPVPIAALLASRSSPLLVPLLVALLAGFFLDLLLVGLLKHLIRRSRPVYNKGMSVSFAVDHWSFPSGHSSRVFFISAFLWLAAGPVREAAGGSDLWRRWGGGLHRYGFEAGDVFLVLVFLWSAATSVSRVLLGRHFVFDVVAGACVGVLEALLVFIFYSWI